MKLLRRPADVLMQINGGKLNSSGCGFTAQCFYKGLKFLADNKLVKIELANNRAYNVATTVKGEKIRQDLLKLHHLGVT